MYNQINFSKNHVSGNARKIGVTFIWWFTEVPIHRHPTKDETFVLLRGRVKVTTHKDDGSIIDDITLCPDEGKYGVNIPKGVWHKVESLEENSVIFECKEGPFVPHEIDGILTVQG